MGRNETADRPGQTLAASSSPATRTRPLLAAVAALAAGSAILAAFPQIDLAVAGFFFVPGEGFPLQQSAALVALRRSGNVAFYGALAAAVLALLAGLLRPAWRQLLPPRPALFLVASAALAPGLLVNLLMKPTFGRARPVDVPPFGANLPFTRAWEISPACSQNCSFPSGEGSSAMWLVALAFVVPRRWRALAFAVSGSYAIALSLNRMAFGGHFLSDIVTAWGLTLLVVLLVHRLVLAEGRGASDAAPDAGH